LLKVGAALSLSGRFARFGRQAAAGLRAWRSLGAKDVELRIEDDESDLTRIRDCVARLAGSCDVLLGPYSGTLMRAAADARPDTRTLIWNHGGAADDVQRRPGARIVSVLTPAGRYSTPFLHHLSTLTGIERLLIVHGRGGFARQVAAGAESLAREQGIEADSVSAESEAWARSRAASSGSERVALLCAGSFEEDVLSVSRARAWPRSPAVVCAVAAGVQEFEAAVEDPAGIFGVAQWIAGGAARNDVGPAEAQFVEAYRRLTGSLPDYPAAQAAASAALAFHCARAAGSTDPEAMWEAACELRTRTFFGEFAIDRESGEQTAHETVLTVWGPEGLARAGNLAAS
jgi:ABC-type branched-subunit amino acid transport system substrate-binding protein